MPSYHPLLMWINAIAFWSPYFYLLVLQSIVKTAATLLKVTLLKETLDQMTAQNPTFFPLTFDSFINSEVWTD